MQLRDDGPLDLHAGPPPIILVATEQWDRLTDKALVFSMQLSPDVVAVHVATPDGADSEEKDRVLLAQWARDVETPALAAAYKPPRLLLLKNPYRRMEVPFLRLVEKVRNEQPDRLVAVLIPEIVKQHWWQYLLHVHRARRLRAAILRHCDSGVVVINVPWHLEPPPDEPIEEDSEEDEVVEPATAADSAYGRRAVGS